MKHNRQASRPPAMAGRHPQAISDLHDQSSTRHGRTSIAKIMSRPAVTVTKSTQQDSISSLVKVLNIPTPPTTQSSSRRRRSSRGYMCCLRPWWEVVSRHLVVHRPACLLVNGRQVDHCHQQVVFPMIIASSGSIDSDRHPRSSAANAMIACALHRGTYLSGVETTAAGPSSGG